MFFAFGYPCDPGPVYNTCVLKKSGWGDATGLSIYIYIYIYPYFGSSFVPEVVHKANDGNVSGGA